MPDIEASVKVDGEPVQYTDHDLATCPFRLYPFYMLWVQSEFGVDFMNGNVGEAEGPSLIADCLDSMTQCHL